MAIRQIGWRHPPGQPYPIPNLKDDRDNLPPDFVRDVLVWLESQKEKFQHHHKPTDQMIRVGTEGIESVRFLGKQTETVDKFAGQALSFEAGTVEILIRDKAKSITVCKYHFLIGRSISITPYELIGPLLWIEPIIQIPS